MKEILKTATFKQSSITFAGTVINGILGIIFYSYTAQLLQPAQYGLFILATTMLTLVSDVTDLGTRTGLVRYVSKYLKTDREKANKFLKFTLEFKIVIGLLVALIGWFVAPLIAENIFKKPELTFPLQLSFLGIISLAVFSFSIAALQAFQKFWVWSNLQIGTNLLRLVVIFILVSFGSFNLDNNLIIYILVPLLGFIASFLFIPTNFLKVKNESSVTNEMFHYSKWIGAFTIIAAISSRMDVFIVGKLLPVFQVGIYGAATQLASVVPQIIVAISTVTAPKMSEMGTKKDLVSYFKKTQALVLGLAGLGLLGIPVSLLAIPFLFGPSFTGSIPVFIVLLVAMLVFLISIPIHNVIIYHFGYSKLFFWLSIGNLLIISILGWFLTLQFGLIGVASTVLINMMFNFIVPLIWGLKKLNE